MTKTLLLMLAAINGMDVPPQPDAPVSIQQASRGLQQASNQAPRVPLDQLVPSSPSRLGIKSTPKPRRTATRRPKQEKMSLRLSQGRCKQFQSTAYGPPWGGIEGTGTTATGLKLKPGKYVVAVDPKIIPLGSKIKVWPNPHDWRGEFLAADTGGAIQGRIVDFFVWQGDQAKYNWGRRSVQVCRN